MIKCYSDAYVAKAASFFVEDGNCDYLSAPMLCSLCDFVMVLKQGSQYGFYLLILGV